MGQRISPLTNIWGLKLVLLIKIGMDKLLVLILEKYENMHRYVRCCKICRPCNKHVKYANIMEFAYSANFSYGYCVVLRGALEWI